MALSLYFQALETLVELWNTKFLSRTTNDMLIRVHGVVTDHLLTELTRKAVEKAH